jgi:hypothetical protein
LSFLDFNEDFSSMVMAGCWLIGVAPLVFLLAHSSGSRPKTVAAA